MQEVLLVLNPETVVIDVDRLKVVIIRKGKLNEYNLWEDTKETFYIDQVESVQIEEAEGTEVGKLHLVILGSSNQQTEHEILFTEEINEGMKLLHDYLLQVKEGKEVTVDRKDKVYTGAIGDEETKEVFTSPLDFINKTRKKLSKKTEDKKGR